MKSFNKTVVKKVNLIEETSFGVTDKQKGVKVSFQVVKKEDEADYGFFEIYDVPSDGEHWYAEGGLWFEGDTLIDYDGVFDLPEEVLDILESEGIDVTDFR